MSSAVVSSPYGTLDELGVLAERVCFSPRPGEHVEATLSELRAKTGRLFEVAHGVLIEKPIGQPESSLTLLLAAVFIAYQKETGLGYFIGPDGPVEFAPGTILIPDLAFTLWERNPGGPAAAIAKVVPDLVVEVLSPSNTPKEMTQKLEVYFGAGVRLAWLIDPRKRTVSVYSIPEFPVVLTEEDTLTGDDVLPGFQLAVRELFTGSNREQK